jgi:acyl-CoA synthetase (AMP-forming)/AMP-acid ligase II
VHSLSDESQPLTVAQLATQARRAGPWLRDLAGPGGTVATLLTASHDCLACLFGALRSGLTLVSLPHPARGMEAGEYLAQIDRMCTLTGASHLVCDRDLVDLLRGSAVPVVAFDRWQTGPDGAVADEEGRFVQFTSGSTGDPRGIELSLAALDANLTSMYDWLEPANGAVVCSWLPLSHDMGLIGLALYAICSVSPPWSVPTDLVLMTPDWFLAEPARWLRACAEFRATSTTSPPFALRLAGRALRSSERFDLSSLRSFVVGSEPVPADGLREFEATAREHGLSPTALCPGYGMAEASLAVAIHPTAVPWSSVRVDPEALAGGVWHEVGSGGTEIVSCGPPVRNTEIRLAGEREVGEIEVRSPSLLSAYIGGTGPPLTSDGWFHTSDLGFLESGEVYVAGRTDDVLFVAGRNLDARALDAVAATHPTCRPGNTACIPDGAGRYVVVAEPNAVGLAEADLRRAAREIRVLLSGRFAASPSDVVFIERGTLPKTPSGKVRRHHLLAQWAAGSLQQLASG